MEELAERRHPEGGRRQEEEGAYKDPGHLAHEGG